MDLELVHKPANVSQEISRQAVHQEGEHHGGVEAGKFGLGDVSNAGGDGGLISNKVRWDNGRVQHLSDFSEFLGSIDCGNSDEVGVVYQVVGDDSKVVESDEWHPAAHVELGPDLGNELVVGGSASVKGDVEWFGNEFPKLPAVRGAGVGEGVEGGCHGGCWSGGKPRRRVCSLGCWERVGIGTQEEDVEAPDGGRDLLVVDVHEASVAVKGDDFTVNETVPNCIRFGINNVQFGHLYPFPPLHFTSRQFGNVDNLVRMSYQIALKFGTLSLGI